MRVLVCGGRNDKNWQDLWQMLDDIHVRTPISLIIQGGAGGADFFAKGWAGKHFIPCVNHPANWPRHGRAAGLLRNQAMLDRWNPELVVAAPGGSGTADMVARAGKAGVKVVRVGASSREGEGGK